MKVPRGGSVKMLWRLCGEGSGQGKSGLAYLVDIAGAGHGLAIQGDAFRQEGGGGEGLAELAVLGAPSACSCSLSGDFDERGAVRGIEGDAAVVGAGPAPALAGQDVVDIGLGQAGGGSDGGPEILILLAGASGQAQ